MLLKIHGFAQNHERIPVHYTHKDLIKHSICRGMQSNGCAYIFRREIDNCEKKIHARFLEGAIFGGIRTNKGTGRNKEMTKTHYMRISRHR
jgi:hypothetical protein